MTKLESIERRLNNLLELYNGKQPDKDSWGRGYEAGYIAALEQMKDMIKEYK